VEVLLYAVGAILLLAGLAGLLLPAIPASLLLFTGVGLLAWAGDFQRIGGGTLVATGVLALAILAVDGLASLLGARVFGASTWALWGATLGALVGLLFGLPGLILGPLVGAVAFEYWKDPNWEKAASAGVGVLVGFLLGSVLKVALGLLLVGLVVLRLAV